MREIVPLLQALIKSINELSDEEYLMLIENKGKLIFKENTPKTTLKSNFMVEKYKNQLDSITSRDEAYLLLKELKKDDLLNFSARYNIYALKSDKKDVIIEKIIESFIGVKLRYNAMKELDLSYRR